MSDFDYVSDVFVSNSAYCYVSHEVNSLKFCETCTSERSLHLNTAGADLC